MPITPLIVRTVTPTHDPVHGISTGTSCLGHLGFVEATPRLIELLLPTGRCSAGQVARSLGVDRRTVHRWLADEGHTFSTLLDATRAGLAHMVGNRRYSLTEVSELLGFSSPEIFSRWFRKHFGRSPTQWRSRKTEGG